MKETIFVSSVQKELREERRAIKESRARHTLRAVPQTGQESDKSDIAGQGEIGHESDIYRHGKGLATGSIGSLSR